MDLEIVVIWVLVLGVVFFVIGKVSIQVFKILFTLATGISVVLLVVLSPFLVLFMGAQGVKRLISRVWGLKERAPKMAAAGKAKTELLGSKED
jgi:hypothetical protein